MCQLTGESVHVDTLSWETDTHVPVIEMNNEPSCKEGQIYTVNVYLGMHQYYILLLFGQVRQIMLQLIL